MHRSPGALFPASHRTSPKLRNPKSKLGRTSPARQQGRKWVELAAARCLCYKPGTPRAETAPGGSGLWTRHPSQPVPSGFQPRPRRTAGSRETDPISRLGRHAKASRGLRSVARCCLRAPGHSSPCQALPSLLDKITTSRGTAAPQSRTAAPKPLAASRPRARFTHPTPASGWFTSLLTWRLANPLPSAGPGGDPELAPSTGTPGGAPQAGQRKKRKV